MRGEEERFMGRGRGDVSLQKNSHRKQRRLSSGGRDRRRCLGCQAAVALQAVAIGLFFRSGQCVLSLFLRYHIVNHTMAANVQMPPKMYDKSAEKDSPSGAIKI